VQSLRAQFCNLLLGVVFQNKENKEVEPDLYRCEMEPLEDSIDSTDLPASDSEILGQLPLYPIRHHLAAPLVELLPGKTDVPRALGLLCQLLLDRQFVQPELFQQRASSQL
jgi:hypothetical protein